MDCHCLHSPTIISLGLRKVRLWRNWWLETSEKNSCQYEQEIACKNWLDEVFKRLKEEREPLTHLNL